MRPVTSMMRNGKRFAGPAKPERCCSIRVLSGPPSLMGVVRYEPGSYHPEHCHGFAQVWYILSGEFTIGGKLLKAGTMLFHPDPHFEGALQTATGGEMLFVQYPGPTTGERPIYDDRFNMKERRPVAEERVDV